MNTFAPAAALSAWVCLLASAPAQASEEEGATARLIEELGLRESAGALRDRPGWAPPGKIVVMGADAGRAAWMQEAAPGVAIVGAADRAAAVREAADADALIGECVPEIIAAGPRIRWVQRMYAGVERCLAIPAFVERGIVLTNMQKVAGSVMAEHVMALMFGLTRGLARYVPAQAAGEWANEAVPEGRMWEVKGRTMLVVGLGGIGTEVAKRAHALGMTVIATRNSGTDGPDYVAEVGLADKLLPFAARADVIVSTLPLTPETRGLMNRAFFDAAKRGALFINVGRGGTVVTGELVAALNDGRLGGAGLDVTDPEPLPPDHPLWRAPNVIITPHVAAALEGNEVARWIIARENLRRYVAGGKLLSEVDLNKGY
ncbi:MAG: D-2-hydroxyacid dehydrogenase [Gammaproteobacteria bacterium]|nr:D-2-hydroxyacid dehydrogenase [Gammaproteobacteria bacterium]